jgi:hypothetical protein
MTSTAGDPGPMGEQSVTIKYGKGYDESWAVFRGTIWEIRANLVAYFGINVDYASGLTLNELVVAATHVAHGTGNVAAILGGTPTPISVTESLTGEPTGDAAWAKIGEQPADGKLPYGGSQAEPVDPNVELIQQLEAAASVDDLKKLWAEHQAAFSDKAVKAAYSKRGKALKAAEKAAASV